MTTTTRAASQAERERIIGSNWVDYRISLWQAEAAMQAEPSAITWDTIHTCRRALQAATAALDAIERQMPIEGRR